MQPTLSPLTPLPSRAVVVAASAGGIPALRALLGALPEEFAAPVIVLQHRAPLVHGYLDQILGGAARLPVREVRDGDPLRAGCIHLCPAGRHVRVDGGRVLRLDDGPPVNFVRPSADVLFASAAQCCGAGTVAVVLTGRGRDGAAGAAAVRRSGGVVLVQDPDGCVAPSMPLAVLGGCGADFALPLDKLAHALVSLVMAPSVSSALFGLPLPCHPPAAAG